MLNAWHYRRDELAQRVLNNYEITESLSLFAPRRTGKTRFVKNDLCRLASEAGYAPLYVDLWANRHDCAQSLIDALRRASEALTVPDSSLGRSLAQPVTGFRILGLGVDLGPEVRANEPTDSLSKIRYWFDRVISESGHPILLIVDEAQQMAIDRDGVAVASALRAALTAHSDRVRSFFTGSSQHNLSRLLDDASAPFYQYAQRIELPQLGNDFVTYLADRFEQSAPQHSLDRPRLMDAFQRLGHAPGPFVEMMTAMLLENSIDIEPYERRALWAVQERIELVISEYGLGIRELAVAARIAHGLSYTGREARSAIQRLEGTKFPIAATQVHRVVEKLVNLSLVDRGRGHGVVQIASWEFLSYLLAHFPIERVE